MLKKITVGACLLLSSIAFASEEASIIHFNDNSTVSFKASITNINRLFVKHDKIIKHVAPEGTFIFDKALSKDGSLYFKPVYSQKPFTLFFSTQKGHHFSALVMPVSDIGQTIQMIANNITEKDARWEKNTGYLKLLQKMVRSMIKGEQSEGIRSQEVTDSKEFVGYPGTSMKLIKVYESAKLSGFIYEIKNQSEHHVSLPERKFWREGVRAVSLSKQILFKDQVGFVYTIVAKG
ncbi:type-F conjugative transfer system secretin TraK [Thiotrichales bacterium 19S9-12]|nr:type-F conjugative transfer system secretin TraK [Thiotrichales bacterium 19S9-11]MCF6812533.1 type-F conjugative transfer system secretin TraK [Thiotrichales bacterium 19S9-12]